MPGSAGAASEDQPPIGHCGRANCPATRFIWVPFIVLAIVAAWFGIDNIASVRVGFAEQVAIVKHKHQWLMSWLYTGTFGSFIGLAAGFPMLVNTQFPAVDAFKFAFIGVAGGGRTPAWWLARRSQGRRTDYLVEHRGEPDLHARSKR